MKIKADLHIHTALSPCGSLEMSPLAIVQRAVEIGLDLIAVTDHNTMQNAFYAVPLGAKKGLKVLYGMEAQTREDVHVLCFFENRKKAERFNMRIYDALPDLSNNSDYFGDQVVVDEKENVVGFERKLLINGLNLGLSELAELVRRHDGEFIPSHVESPPFGLMVVLGMVPREWKECVLEVSSRSSPQEVLESFPELQRHSLIGNSDAHSLGEIGRVYTEYETASRNLGDLFSSAKSKRFFIHRGG